MRAYILMNAWHARGAQEAQSFGPSDHLGPHSHMIVVAQRVFAAKPPGPRVRANPGPPSVPPDRPFLPTL
jgi:hypothetical protein